MMAPLFTSVLLASLVGSPHCVGMCGPLVVLAMRDENARGWQQASAYHGGRLLSYLILGAAAGALGGSLDLGGSLLGFQRIAMSASAVFLIGFGLHQLAKARGWTRPKQSKPPGPLARTYLALQRRTAKMPPLRRAGGLGLLSSFLPCGWLYAFAAVSAGTGSALFGALVMGAFWMGSVPLLAAFGMGTRKLMGPMERYVPSLTALLLVAAGLFVLSGRMGVVAPDLARAAEEGSTDGALRRATTEDPSCCTTEESQ